MRLLDVLQKKADNWHSPVKKDEFLEHARAISAAMAEFYNEPTTENLRELSSKWAGGLRKVGYLDIVKRDKDAPLA
jgi:hypothetical protein